MQSYKVRPQQSGWRLDLFLSKASGLSRTAAQAEIKEGRVSVAGEVEKASHLVKDGDKVDWTAAEPVQADAPDIPIIYEDKDVIVIDKPADLLSHAVSAKRPEPSVAEFARSRVADDDPLRPGLVHRLDKDTSGVMILAKNAKAKAHLMKQFKERQAHKTYLALVEGGLEPTEAIIKLPLAPSHDYEKRTVQQGGKEAVTRYKVKQYLPGYTLLIITPQTGRTHQIRVHLAHLNHPIAGDTTYGGRKRPLGLSRQFLHAAKLEIQLPNGQTKTFSSPLPEDLQGFLDFLEKQYN